MSHEANDEMYNYCVLCNPEVNWLEVEFRSENDEPINGLHVTITNSTTLQSHKLTAYQGHCVFGNLTAGEWVVSVETENLLSTVEQYSSRPAQVLSAEDVEDNEFWDDGFMPEDRQTAYASPVRERAEREKGAAHLNTKEYFNVSVGDLWQTPPEDSFLLENHAPVMSNYNEAFKGVRVSHNRTVVLEIKALRSYLPMIVDTDDFNLVNSYTFAVLSKLAYATDTKSIDENETSDIAGSISYVIKMLKGKKVPPQTSNLSAQWLVEEVPYSQALNYNYYFDKAVGAEGYILFNQDIAIVGVRGTEPYLDNRDKDDENRLWKVVKTGSGIQAYFWDKLGDAVQSPATQDLILTDLDAAQIAPPEFGGTYVHRGFYQYTMALLMAMEKDLDIHKAKKFYFCGHSLGGAGALLLSALIRDTYHPSTLCLYTYGMPRTGTRSFVERYKDILHYRHVNNHDLVAQIPTTWLNTSAVNIAHNFIFDDDDDNYTHHGNLSQLLSCDDTMQVLLTPRQTQVTMLDMVKLADNDSVALVDSIPNSSIIDHGMEHYVPNLFAQLQALSQESLYQNYQRAVSYLTNKVNEQQQRYLAAKHAWAESLGLPYSPVNQARTTLLKQEAAVTEELMKNYHKVKQELTNIMNNPEKLPLSLLLLANQSLPDAIREQINESH
ncbi:lipase family protein [Vibrio algivorus]|uniref:Lipase n=1 Tax=Vibrio algivorus TaxID=1667024 RepID=A0A557PFP0_9VIBR|nr:lipase [Vibrio algivorus]TVO39452.1 lipase [Vibrio algivorus]